MKRVLICAGAHVQARLLAEQLGLQPTEWAYLDGVSRMRGLRGITLLMFGTWQSRKDIDEILVASRECEMPILYIHDGRS